MESFFQFDKEWLNLDISNNAKLLFMLIMDRSKVSFKNHLVDGDWVILYYEQEDLAKTLGVSRRSIINYMKELEEKNLIKKDLIGRHNKLSVKRVKNFHTSNNKCYINNTNLLVTNKVLTISKRNRDYYLFDELKNTEYDIVYKLHEELSKRIDSYKRKKISVNNVESIFEILVDISTNLTEYVLSYKELNCNHSIEHFVKVLERL